MALDLTPRSELDAVNTMLEVIGEQPTSSLDVSGLTEVSLARQLLHNVSREVQNIGWSFNSEEEYPLVADINGNVMVPADALEVDPTDRTVDYIVRGTQLYDKTNHTYNIGKTVDVNIIFFLPFENLPQAAREYITIKAARQFQTRFLGSDSLFQMTAKDEQDAWVNLLSSESSDGDYSIFDDYSVYRVIRRNR